MAPPDRGDTPLDPKYTDYLSRVKLADNPRLGHNANRLASWVEWLLTPDTHEHDRTVIYDDGTRREETHRVTEANPAPGQYEPIEVDHESVIEGYDLSRFLDPMVAVASQRVEAPDSMMSIGGAALKNVWWLGDEHAISLAAGFPTEQEWSGDTAKIAKDFVLNLSEFATQVNKIVDQFHHIAPRYAVIIRALRQNLDRAAADLVAAFEEKFGQRPDNVTFDVVGIVLSATAAAAVTYMTGGAALPIMEAAMTTAWSATFTQAFDQALKQASQGSVHGGLWRDLAKSYFATVADIVTRATDAMNELDMQLGTLLGQFEAEVVEFLGEGAI